MVGEVKPRVIWGKRAFKSLNNAYNRIKNESLVNAEMVRDDILNLTKELSKHPEKYPPDKFKRNNDANQYRAFEKHTFRIAYKYTDKQIIIIRFRHARQEPKQY